MLPPCCGVPEELMPTREPIRGSIILGLGLVAAGNVFGFGILSLFMGVQAFDLGDYAVQAMTVPAVSQLAWALPLAVVLLLLGRRRTVIGMVIAVVGVIVLNVAGWGIVAIT